jgi:acetylxylan esterase
MGNRKRLSTAVAALAVACVTAAGWLLTASPASAASLVEVTNFGANPTNLRMHLYVPDRVAARPGILVAAHYCTGSGPAFYTGTGYKAQADRYGFIVIYPSVTRASKCWDVSSPQALRRGGGSDPVGVVSMVDYVKQRYNADPGRIFAAGGSSGSMMTNVLLGDYPDVFAAGASFAGVPFACFATTNGSEWNSDCAQGRIIKTPQQWGDLVRNAYPGYTGRRPRMQIWHGTNDDTLRYPNFGEQVKQWTNVHGLNQTPAFTDTPKAGYTRARYGGTGGTAPVEAISLQGWGHGLPDESAEVIRFFGLNSPPPPTTPPPSSPPPSSPPPTGGQGCTATQRIVNTWQGGFQADVTVANNASAATNGWRVTWTLPSGQTISQVWNGTLSASGGNAAVTNASYNGVIAPGGSTTFGMIVNGSAGSAPALTCAST